MTRRLRLVAIAVVASTGCFVLAGAAGAGSDRPLRVDFGDERQARDEGFERIGSTVGAESTFVDGALRVELELGTAPLVPDPNGPPVRRYPDGVRVDTTVRLLEGPHDDVRAGVLCMTSEQGADGFYAFFAEPDGEFSIVKWPPLGAPEVLEEGRRRPKRADGPLTVAATCRPKGKALELVLVVHGDEVARTVDRDPLDFDSQVGLVVEQPDAVTIEPVVAEFAKMRARAL